MAELAPASKEQFSSLLGARSVPSYNQAAVSAATTYLEAPRTTADKEKARKQLYDAFVAEAKRLGVATNQTYSVQTLPSVVTRSFLNRLDQRALADMWALNFGIRLQANWGDTLAYRTVDEFTPTVHKIGAPGGNFQQLYPDPRDNVFYLGEPVIYTTPEFLIPRWDWYYPDRYLDEIEYLADKAGRVIAQQVDSDAKTALTAQLVASGMRTRAWNYIESDVYGIPDTNILDYSSSPDNWLGRYESMIQHADLTNRRIESIYMHPSTVYDTWDMYKVAGANYFAALPDPMRAQLVRDGEGVFTYLFGETIPAPTKVNSIDVTGDDKYFWVSLTPKDPSVPKGAFWLYDFPGTRPVNAGGQAFTVDMLQYVRSQANDGRILDVYVAQSAYLLAYCDFQLPNVSKVQYDT